MQQAFPRRIDALPRVFAFAAEFCDHQDVDDASRYAVEFALEEIFTNLVKYHPGNPHEITIRLERADDRLRVVFTNVSAESFDIRTAPERATDVPIEQRQPGGLGLQLTRRMMDEVDYEYDPPTSTITLTRRLR